MREQNYRPLMDSIGWSTVAATVPIVIPLLLIGASVLGVLATVYVYAF